MLPHIYPDALTEIFRKVKDREPFGLARFNDGEAVALFNRRRGWRERYNTFHFTQNDPGYDEPVARLLASMRFQAADYFVGISCGCCHGGLHDQLRELSQQREGNLTWANVLCNGNYAEFKSQMPGLMRGREVHVVGLNTAVVDKLPFAVEKFWPVEPNSWVTSYSVIAEIRDYIDRHNTADAIFLSACGPLANILGHELFRDRPQNTYIDVGSTLDPWLFRRGWRNKKYLRPGSSRLEKVCKWGTGNESDRA